MHGRPQRRSGEPDDGRDFRYRLSFASRVLRGAKRPVGPGERPRLPGRLAGGTPLRARRQDRAVPDPPRPRRRRQPAALRSLSQEQLDGASPRTPAPSLARPISRDAQSAGARVFLRGSPPPTPAPQARASARAGSSGQTPQSGSHFGNSAPWPSMPRVSKRGFRPSLSMIQIAGLSPVAARQKSIRVPS